MTHKVITCCTHKPTAPYYFLDSFLKSLKGHEPLILDQRFGRWGGLATKTKWLRMALKDNMIKEDILIICDCYDFVFAGQIEELVEAFKTYNSPCVISSEKNYWPDEGLKPDFDKHNFPTSFKYINSGLVVSEKDALIAILESMDLDNYPDDHQKPDGNMFHSNDQFLYQREFVRHPDLIQVDYKCKISQTLSELTVDDFEFLANGKIKNKETGETPCSFHANGGSKTSGIVPPILNHLGLN
ncbi:MAG TPA: hypothetical protein VFG24_09425, partial [Nitrosopumilaceae archaeon]|nr:hypothetical protein [Nitrosopumilaceae archaeon]